MIDIRNPRDRFKALRARISALGSPAGSDRGAEGAPLTVDERALLIEDIVTNPGENAEGPVERRHARRG